MRILLVDDDTSIIQTLLAVLRAQPGFDVRVATTGEKAIEQAANLGGVDVLITDVVMEPMDGFTLREELRRLYPGLTCILMSGYDLSDYADQTAGSTLLMKPITPDVLLQTIRAVTSPVSMAPSGGATPSPISISVPQVSAQPKASAQPAVAAIPAAPGVAAVPPQTPGVEAEPVVEPPVEAPSYVPPAPSVSAAPEPNFVADLPLPGSASAAVDILNLPVDQLIGKTLGNYRLIRRFGESEWGPIYGALQTSMNRPVALQLLSAELANDPQAKTQFQADASAKANVQHPTIISVYEGGEAFGLIFYTLEFVEGETLAAYQKKGLTIDEVTALRTIRAVAEALSYLNHNRVPHLPLTPGAIFIDNQQRPRLSNIATGRDSHPSTQEEMQKLSRYILDVLPGGMASEPGLQSMLIQMQQSGSAGFASWGALLQGVRALEPKVIPVDAFKLSAQDQVAIRAVERAKKAQKRQMIYSIAAIFVVFWVAVWIILSVFGRSNERALDVQVEIPPGEFTYQDGKKARTEKPFWIDKHEVTIGQYAKFLKYLEDHPDEVTKFDNPKQPKGMEHKPKDFDIWYRRANARLRMWQVARFVPVDLNCPVFNVTFWDAWAYAKWKGRRLPTEVEWEKAARGEKGNLYPWGNKWDPKACNNASDYIKTPGPKSKADVDGFFWFSPVDAFSDDRSPYGVIGMAGNVYEWTDTWEKNTFPVIRGGSFKSIFPSGPEANKPDCRTTRRETGIDAEFAFEALGFRTVSDEPPQKK